MNKLINRYQITTGTEKASYTTAKAVTKTYSTERKRWKATMLCGECGNAFTVREQPKGRHLEKPCSSCAKRKIAYKNFIKKALMKHGDRFDYSLVTEDTYVDLFHKVDIICKEHGIFSQKPKDHTSPSNAKLCCPDCIKAFNRVHNKRSIDTWKQELNTKFPNITMVEHGNSECNTEACVLECSHHGTFQSTLASIKKCKHLCPLCAQDKNSWGGRFRRTDISGTLYLIYLPTLNMWKLGVTSMLLAKRFHRLSLPYTVVWEHSFKTLKEAYEEEVQLFRTYKNFRRGRQLPDLLGKAGGSTELLTCEIPITAIHSSDTMSKKP